MASADLPDHAPATGLFPQFDTALFLMISDEAAGLTQDHLDFETDRWEWSKWSIRRNLSHMASGDFRWFGLRWGQRLFAQTPPQLEGLDILMSSRYDRRLDEEQYWDLDAIMGKLRDGLDLCWLILTRETVGSLRRKELDVGNTGLWTQYPQLFPGGIRRDPGDPSRLYITLEATFRHRYYEHITHLYNIQRLKRAQGLASKVEIPFEGYWAMPGWDRSEP